MNPIFHNRDYPDTPSQTKLVRAGRDVTSRRWEWRHGIADFAFVDNILLDDYLHWTGP